MLFKLSNLNSNLALREGTFFIGGGGGWAGASEGEGHSFFGKEKITSCHFYFVYTSKATSQD